jgi:hypothetical protein
VNRVRSLAWRWAFWLLLLGGPRSEAGGVRAWCGRSAQRLAQGAARAWDQYREDYRNLGLWRLIVKPASPEELALRRRWMGLLVEAPPSHTFPWIRFHLPEREAKGEPQTRRYELDPLLGTDHWINLPVRKLSQRAVEQGKLACALRWSTLSLVAAYSLAAMPVDWWRDHFQAQAQQQTEQTLRADYRYQPFQAREKVEAVEDYLAQKAKQGLSEDDIRESREMLLTKLREQAKRTRHDMDEVRRIEADYAEKVKRRKVGANVERSRADEQDKLTRLLHNPLFQDLPGRPELAAVAERETDPAQIDRAIRLLVEQRETLLYKYDLILNWIGPGGASRKLDAEMQADLQALQRDPFLRRLAARHTQGRLSREDFSYRAMEHVFWVEDVYAVAQKLGLPRPASSLTEREGKIWENVVKEGASPEASASSAAAPLEPKGNERAQ